VDIGAEQLGWTGAGGVNAVKSSRLVAFYLASKFGLAEEGIHVATMKIEVGAIFLTWRLAIGFL
jgi:hypothetical protein